MEALNLIAKSVPPRETAQVRLTNDKGAFEAPIGTPLEEYVRAAYPDRWRTIVGGVINGKLSELTTPITADCSVEPIDVSSRDGMRFYRRSLTFLLITAARELFPTATIEIDHSLPFGGYYCVVLGREPLTNEELQALQAHMREIVNANEAIVKARIPLADAQAIFERQGYDDKLRLLNYRTKDYLTVYTLRGLTDYFYGYMVPSTGYLRTFALTPLSNGFVLQFPRRAHPDQLEKADRPSRLAAVFQLHAEYMRVMEVEDVGSLNQAIESKRIREVIMVAEALHERRIAETARAIAQKRDQIRLILIAGPSSSGKTTFSKRLAVQLLAYGLRPIAIEMDNYFVDREKTPRDKNGEYDFEAFEALEHMLFSQQLKRTHRWARGDAAALRFPDWPARHRSDDRDFTRSHRDRRGHSRAESQPAARPPAGARVSHLCVGVDAAQHRSSQSRAHFRHAPDAAHRARCARSRACAPRHHSHVGQSARRRESQHFPLSGKRRHHVQLGAGVRAGRVEITG